MNETVVVIVRGVIGFFTLLILTRILGKEQISQLTYFEYILGITIGSTASSLTTDLTSRAWPHWVGLTTWAALVLIMQYITLKSRFAAKYLAGEPTIVIMDGKIMEKSMRIMRYRLNDLLEQLREKDVFDLTEVAFAVLETDGKLSVLKKPEFQPVTPKDLSIPVGNKGISTELIYDGIIIPQNLKQINQTRTWLESQLKARGISDPSEVFLASFDPSGNLYIDTYKDHMTNMVDPSDYPGPN